MNTRLKRGLAQLRRSLARERGDWWAPLGLLAGESPCLPPHAGEKLHADVRLVVIVAVLGTAALVEGLWQVLEPSEPRSTSAVLSSGDASKLDPTMLSAPAADASGAFVFERLERGAHALWIDTGGEVGELLAGVRLDEGAESEVELRLGGASLPELEVPGLAPEARARLEGVLVGLDGTFGLCWFENGTLEGRALPGRYWLATRALVTGDAIAAPVTVVEGDPLVRARIGSATLVVRSKERRNVQVVPEDADPFTRLVAARAWVKAEGESEARFRLDPGRYRIVGEAGVVLRAVDVPVEGAVVALD